MIQRRLRHKPTRVKAAQPGKNKNQQMKRTEVVPLKYCSELDKVQPGGHALLVLTGDH